MVGHGKKNSTLDGSRVVRAVLVDLGSILKNQISLFKNVSLV